ncbi:sulfite reductase subunit alpha [Denitratisoma sp. agr-D3]
MSSLTVLPWPRLLAALLAVLAYAALCRWSWRRAGRQADTPHVADGDSALLPVVHASQTGFAQLLAEETALSLQRGGRPARPLSLAQLSQGDLARLIATDTPLLLVVSTSGEGDSPDEAADFVAGPMATAPSLAGLRYGLLALGDDSYANFCAFGRRLDHWLQQQGAQALFPAIEVNRGDEGAIAAWQHRVGALASTLDTREEAAAPLAATAFASWRILRREHLNAGSEAAPVVRLDLVPAATDAPLPTWEAGDLALIQPPAGSGAPRAYSIASLPGESSLQLLVRQRRDEQGKPGLVSGWLTQAPVGTLVPLRLRTHAAFRIGANTGRPLILIGTGTGMAGLRAHLAARAAQGDGRNWLLFGEREAARDFHFGTDIRRWQDMGLLARLDLAFSRTAGERVYVQDRLAAAGNALRHWLAEGAAIYLCGNAATLAPAVDAVLTELIGADALEALLAEGRYRRDVY